MADWYSQGCCIITTDQLADKIRSNPDKVIVGCREVKMHVLEVLLFILKIRYCSPDVCIFIIIILKQNRLLSHLLCKWVAFMRDVIYFCVTGAGD